MKLFRSITFLLTLTLSGLWDDGRVRHGSPTHQDRCAFCRYRTGVFSGRAGTELLLRWSSMRSTRPAESKDGSFSWFSYDTQGDATKAVQAATRLIKDDKVVAIIGPSTTGDTMAIIQIVEKAQIPLISCAAGIKITDPVKKWVFKTAQNDSLAVSRIYEYLNKTKIGKVSILTVSDSFGSSGREQLVGQAGKFGIQIVSDDTYGPKDTDMTAQLTKVRSGQAQALICWGTNPGPAVIARNAKQLGLKIPVFHESRGFFQEVHRTG